MPIKSMKCACCGSKDVFLTVCLGRTGYFRLYDNGNVENYSNGDIEGYESEDEVSIIDLLDNIPLPQKDWDLLGLSGKLHTNPNHISCPSVSITGECQKCEDECSLVVKFEDGTKLEEQDALIKLVNELRNPTPIIVKSSSTKISTEYIKTLIPQYVKEHFGDKTMSPILDNKNWKRISKSKDSGKILRVFEYKMNPEIKLYINSNESDTEIIGYEFQEGNIITNLLTQIMEKTTTPKNKFDRYFIAEIVDMDNDDLGYNDSNYNFLVSINTVEAKKTGFLVDHYTKEEAKVLDPIFEEFNMCEFVESVYELEDNELTREEFAVKLREYNIFSEVKIHKSKQTKSEIKYVFCAFERPQDDYFFSGTTLVLTPKKYWNKEKYVWDQDYPRKIINILDQYGFSECMESMFNGDLTPDEIKEKLKTHPEFEYDKNFEKFNKRHV